MNNQHYYEEQNFELISLYYEAVKNVLGEEYTDISNEEIEYLLEDRFATMSAEEIESFWKSVSNTFKKVGKTALKALPAVAPIAGKVIGGAVGSVVAPGIGTALGATLGGQLGNLAGAAAGKASQSKSPSRKAQQRPQKVQSKHQSQRMQQRIPFTKKHNISRSPKATGKPAVNQLMTLMNNPSFIKTVLGQVMGKPGNNSIFIATHGESKEVPFGAFMTALSELAERAAIEANQGKFQDWSASYIQDEKGEYVCDPASAEERTEVLTNLLSQNYIEERAVEDENYHDDLTQWFIEAELID